MSKLTKIFFGRRTLAIVVAIVMVLQLLPFATLADDANDASDAEVSTEDVVTVDPAVAESGEETVIDEISEDPAEPTDPENPENPAEPADPENPVNPEEPVEPAEPADPEEPVEPADPENPVNPEEPVEPAEPVDPEEPVAEPETEEAGNQVFTSGKVTVTGYLPVGGDVTVAPVNAGISPQMAPSPDGSTGAKSQKVLASYDIKIVDSEGAEWPLQERVQVTVRLDGNYANYTGPIKVYHYRVANGNCIGTYQAVGGEVTFPASSFSVYILVKEEDEDPETGITVTYNFYVGETLFNTEILRNGDTIEDPGIPTLGPNTTFHGWFDESNQQVMIGSTVESTTTKTIKVSAKIVTTYYVTFYGQDGETVQVKEVLLETGETSKTVDTTDVSIIPKLDTQTFKGWSDTQNPASNATPVSSVTVSNGNIQLYPIITKSFWIRFDENDGGTGGGASYTGPVAVEEGQLASSVQPNDPTRIGYRFDGWYTDQACNTSFEWNSYLTDHVLLYAKWTPVDTKYTVVFWQQKATDSVGMADSAKSYDYYDSVERTALTGSEVAITNADTRRGGTTGSAMGFYFTYNGTRSDTDAAVVLGDGSTVLNVYYDRKVITFNFYTYGGLFTGWELVKTLTGLYRSSVNAADWPNPGSNNYWYESSSGDSAWYTTPLLVYAVPGEDAATEQNLYARESDDHGNGKNITFLGQDTSGNYTITLHQEKLYRNQVYRLNDEYLGFTVYKYNTNGNNINSASDATPATTISYDDIDKNNGAYVYYTRNIWTLKFHSNNEDVKTEDVYYQADLSEYGTFVPTNGPVGHRFAGWYADPAFGTEFDFDTTMINASVTVYAKWEKLRYHIHLDPNGGELYGTQIGDFDVDFEEILDRTSLENSVRRENWVLVGWFDEATGKAYAYGKVTSDVNLIAKWRFPGLVKVVYDAGENGTNPPSDNGNYSGASAVVVGRPSDANPGYMFVGWKIQGVENSANYLPNDIFEIPNEAIVIDPNNHDRGTVTLVADYLLIDMTVFGKTSVTFDPNGGSGSAVTVSGVQINESFEAAAASAAGTLEGYTFIGWSKTQKTTGYTEDDVFCQAGATLFADNEDLPNTLYAAWKINTYTVKFDANGGTGTAMADEIYEYNEEKALTKNTYTREGFRFLGWSTDPNVTSAEYSDEQVVKNLTELVKTQNGAVVTLYAVWEVNTTTISGNKIWEDGDNVDNTRPESITITLSSYVKGTSSSTAEVVETKTVTADDNWAYAFDVPLYNEEGKELVYTVSEDPVDGYKTYSVNDSYNIKNTYAGSLTLKKVVVDGPDVDQAFTFTLSATLPFAAGIRDVTDLISLILSGSVIDREQGMAMVRSMIEQLLSSGQSGESSSFTVTITLKNGEYVTIPEIMRSGTTYTITETGVTGYVPSCGDKTGTNGSDLTVSGTIATNAAITFTNTYTPLTISGVKTWDDNDNAKGVRPESINVLLKVGEEIVDSKTVTAEDDWTYTFENVPEYDEEGNKIEYTIAEEPVENYVAQVNGYNITNTYNGKPGTLTITKTVVDAPAADAEKEFSFTLKMTVDPSANKFDISTVTTWINTFLTEEGVFDPDDKTAFLNALTNALLSGSKDPITITTEFKLKDGQSLVIPELAYGTTYEITESGEEKYTASSGEQTGTLGGDLTVSATIDGDVTVPFTNTYDGKPGTLTITKTVVDAPAADAEKEFSFTLKMTVDPSANKFNITTLTTWINTFLTEEGVFDPDDKTAFLNALTNALLSGSKDPITITTEFKLKDGQSLVIPELAYGTTYEITESGEEKYTASSGEQTGTLGGDLTVSATIDGDVTVPFTNTYDGKPGTLTITKTVVDAPAADAEKEFSFTLKMTVDPSANKFNITTLTTWINTFLTEEGVFDPDDKTAFLNALTNALLSGSKDPITITTEFKLKDGQSLVIPELAYGTTYEITESGEEKYTASSGEQTGTLGGDLTVSATIDGDVTVPFTNTYDGKPGTLTITKTVVDAPAADAEKEFSFTLKMTVDPSANKFDISTLSAWIDTFLEVEEGIFDPDDQTAFLNAITDALLSGSKDPITITTEFKLKDGQSLVIPELAYGTTYEITESGEEKYTASSGEQTGTLGGDLTVSATIDGDVTVPFTNTYDGKPGTLTITKTVVDAPAADAEKEFSFTLKMTVDPSANKFNITTLTTWINTFLTEEGVFDPDDKTAFLNALTNALLSGSKDPITITTEFKLKDGQSLVIPELAYGTTYEITESGEEKYTASSGEQTGTLGGDLTVSATIDGDVTVPFTNTYDGKPGTLTITKTVVDAPAADAEKEFSFTLKMTVDPSANKFNITTLTTWINTFLTEEGVFDPDDKTAFLNALTNALLSGSKDPITITTEFKLKDGQSLVIPELAYGTTYEITESGEEKYTARSGEQTGTLGGDLTVSATIDGDVTVPFTNTYDGKPGTLTITKTVVDAPAADAEKEFSFTLKMTVDPSANSFSIDDLTAWIDTFLEAEEGIFDPDDQTAFLNAITDALLSGSKDPITITTEFKLKDGQSLVIPELAYGTTYEITESGEEKYTAKSGEQTGTLGGDLTVSATIDGDVTVPFTNTYDGKPGTLTITKTVVDAPAADAEKEFSFTLKMTVDPSANKFDISTVTTWINTFLTEEGVFDPDDKTAFLNALTNALLSGSKDPITITTEFKLKDGQSLVIPELAYGTTYEITESGEEKYTAKSGEQTGTLGGDLTVSATIDGDVTVPFTNTYDGKPGTLTITKTVVDAPAADAEKEFSFTLKMTVDPSANKFNITTLTTWIDTFLEAEEGIFDPDDQTAFLNAITDALLSGSKDPITITTEFKLKDGQSLVIPELAYGTTYEITESGEEKYTAKSGEQTGTLGGDLTVSATIDGDVTVPFTNTYDGKPGTLTITKTVVDAPAADAEKEFSFTLKMTVDPSANSFSIDDLTAWIDTFLEAEEGIFDPDDQTAFLEAITNALLSGSKDPITITTEFKLKDGQSLVIPELAYGTTYEITESGEEKYTASSGEQTGTLGGDLTVSATIDGDVTVPFTNTYDGKPGTLTITKTVVDAPAADAEKEFSFTLKMTVDPSANKFNITTLTTWIDTFLEAEEGIFDPDDQTAFLNAITDALLSGSKDPITITTEFKLKDGQSLVIPELAYGTTYEITESGEEKYTAKSGEQTGTLGGDLTVSATIDGDVTVPFTNTYDGKPGTLTITKTVVDAPAADAEKEFSFTLKMTVDPSANKFNITTLTTWIDTFLEAEEGIFDPDDQTAFLNAITDALLSGSKDPITITTEFKLKDGQSLVIPELAYGTTYEITESGEEKYTAKSGEQTGTLGGDLTVSATIDGDVTVPFTNTYDGKPGTLTITKTVVDAPAADAEKEFSFTLKMTVDPSANSFSIDDLTAWIDTFLEAEEGIFDPDDQTAFLNAITDALLSGSKDPITITTEFKLKDGQSLVIPELAYGTTYEITESGEEKYTARSGEQTGTLGGDLTVSATIDGDVTVPFTNTYDGKPGTLTITKTVVDAPAADAEKEFSFTLKMTVDPSANSFSIDDLTAWIDTFLEAEEGIFDPDDQTAFLNAITDALLSGSKDPITITTEFKLKDGQSLVIPELAYGTTYEITESGEEKYTARSGEQTGTLGGDLTVSATIDGDVTVPFTNTYDGKPGTLTITKTVVDAPAADAEKEFSFTLKMTVDPSANKFNITTLTTWIDTFLEAEEGIFDPDDQTAFLNAITDALLSGSKDPITITTEFKLKDGQSLVIPELAYGTTYEITESGEEKYTARSGEQTGTLGGDLTVSATIDGDVTVPFTNTYDGKPGTLTITKTVVDAPAADAEKEFSFTLKMTVDPSANKFNITTLTTWIDTFLKAEEGIFDPDDKTAFLNAITDALLSGSKDPITITTEFKLKDGQSLVIPELAYGTTYEITESGEENYIPSSGEQTGTLGGDLTVSATIDGDVAVPFTNTYGKVGTLTLSKTVVDAPTEDADKEYTFRVKMTIKNPAGLKIGYDTMLIDAFRIGRVEGGEAIIEELITLQLTGTATEFTFEAEFKLKDGESIEFTGLGYGSKYEITEIGTDYYVASCGDKEGELAGSLTVSAMLEGEDATVAFTNTYLSNDVNSADVTVEYDGKSHTVTATAKVEGSTIWFSIDGGATWTKDAPIRVNVGTTDFAVKATKAGYRDVIKDGYKLTVTPKGLTININDASKVYGEADPELTYEVDGLVEGETIPTGLITIWRDAGEDVGTYPIHGKIGTISSTSKVRIKPAARRSPIGLKGSNAFDMNNYNIKINEGIFEITPAEVTVTADSFTKKQGEADPTFTAKVTGLVNGDDESVISYTLNREAGEEPGTYAITPTGEAVQGNYKVIFVPGKLTITAKDKEVELGEFSLLWVSDTLLKGEGAYDDAFKAIVEYAEKNAKAFGAIAMVSTGNLVDAFDNEAAWTSAKNSLKGLTGMQFLGVAGTKDVNGDEMNYDAYLAAKLNGMATSYKDGSIWYRSFGSKNLMLVGIGYQKIAETDEEKDRQNKWLAFVNETIAVHRSEKVVLILNDYMDATGELTPFGKLIEEKVVKGNKNVIMVLCGNADGAVHKEMTYGERKVAVAMFNYAADEENGLGLVRVITFNSKDKTIEIQTIDAIEGKARAYDPLKPEEDSFRFEDLF